MKSQLKSVFIFVFFLAVWVLIALAVEWQPDMGFKGFNSSLLLKEEIILADGTKLLKSADNKTMEIAGFFNHSSSSAFYLLKGNNEWGYLEAVNETLVFSSSVFLIENITIKEMIGDAVCLSGSYNSGIIRKDNTLEMKLPSYEKCVFYPQEKRKSFSISNNQLFMEGEAGYDPTIIPVILNQCYEENAATGATTDASGDCELGYDGAVRQLTGAHYKFVDIPQGSVCVNANLSFLAAASTSTAANFTVYFDDVDNSTAITMANFNLSQRAKTSAVADWLGAESWTAGNTYFSPNICAPIQEVLNRAGWVQNNSLTVVVIGNGTRNSDDVDWTLSIEWAAGGPDVTAPTFTVYNESTTNSSSIVSSLASEAANSTWFIYNTTGLVYNVTNTSFGTLQSFFVGSLQNFTNYLVNLTRCDSSGNCATNRTFNFTTRQNAAPAAAPDVASYINLSFPANNSVFTDPSWLNFSANGSGFHKLYNMTLYINNTRNASADKSVGGGVDYYIGNFSANISAGFYIWRIEIQNATGGFNISESRYFTVNFTDSVAPTFTIYNESTTNISTILSSLASEAANSTFRVYNDTVLVYNVTNTSFGTLQSFFVGSLSNGTTYWVNLTRCDSSGNCATNKTFNFTTRFNPPGPDITAPTFTIYNESTTNISTILSSLASEAANSTWWIYNATELVYNVSNASYGTFHSFFLGSLQNFTTYWVNLTRCDAAANCATNKTFNFTTAQNTNDSVAVSAASAPPGGSFIQEIQEAQSKGLAEYILYILGKYPFTSFGVFVFFVILSERKYKRKTLVLKKEVFHVPKKDYNIN